jgi:elongation factor P
MPKINGNEIRAGHVLSHKGGLWQAVKINHVKPGKGGAFAQVELKNLKDGTKLNERFRSSENVDRVRLDQKTHQFLYEDGDMLCFMSIDDYEQISMPSTLLGERKHFLQDGMNVEIESYEGAPLTIRLPEQIILEVIEADPVVKGQTATASYKPAVMHNQIKIMVPPFISVGEKIVVDSETAEYVKRASEK